MRSKAFAVDNPYASQKLTHHERQLSMQDQERAGAVPESEAAYALHGNLVDGQPPTEQREPATVGQSQMTQSYPVSSKATPNVQQESTGLRAEIDKSPFKEDGRK